MLGNSGRHAPSADELTAAIAVVMAKATSRPSAKEVRDKLLQDNPTWTIPERRVQKFVKRRNSNNKNGDEISLLSMGSAGNRKGFFGLMVGSNKQDGPLPESYPEISEASVTSTARLGAKIKKAGVTVVKALSPRKKPKARVTAKDPPGGMLTIGAEKLALPTIDLDNSNNNQDMTAEEAVAGELNIAEKKVGEEEVAVATEEIAEETKEDEQADSRNLAYIDDNDGKKGGALCEGCAGCIIL